MSNNNERTGKTLGVVILLCLVCSIVVAGTAVGLRTRQQQQQQLDQQRTILQVVGLLSPEMGSEQITETFHRRLQPRLIDLASGELIAEDASPSDRPTTANSPNQSRALMPEEDVAHIQRRANQQQIYLVVQPSGEVESVVLPLYGNGLWAMMYAFIAIRIDGSTVQGLSYYQHGETPGLGGEVDNPLWRQQWVGKQLFNAQNQLAIQLKKGGDNKLDPHAVDALSGATLTTKGVQGTLNFWLGPLGYGPFLAKIRGGSLNHG